MARPEIEVIRECAYALQLALRTGQIGWIQESAYNSAQMYVVPKCRLPKGCEAPEMCEELCKCTAAVQENTDKRPDRASSGTTPGPAPAAPDVAKVLLAAKNMDWMQVALNGGPPCFHLQEDGRFCGRAERWDGHDGDPHNFVSLAALLTKLGPGASDD